jgi:MtN3 and saliva related transmembrane protein
LISTIFGYIAAACTTISFVPQAIKVYKTKSTRDISLGMFLLMSTGVAFWLIYGVMISSYPIVLANSVTLFLSFYILIMKIKIEISGS